jgi:hypothetical protein
MSTLNRVLFRSWALVVLVLAFVNEHGCYVVFFTGMLYWVLVVLFTDHLDGDLEKGEDK